MNKKGASPIIIVIAAIAFTAVIIILWLSFFAIPGLYNVAQKEITIGSDVEKSDVFVQHINLINFLRSQADEQRTVSELMVSLHAADKEKSKNGYQETAKKLDESANNYLAIYGKKCVIIELQDDQGNIVWEARTKSCLFATGANLLKPLSKAEISLPTHDPQKNLLVTQEFIYTYTPT